MILSLQLTKEEKLVAENYARRHSMSLEKAFREALFERIKEECGAAAALDEAQALAAAMEDLEAGRTVDGDTAISNVRRKYGV